MPGQAVDGQDLGRAGRSVTMHVQQVGHGLDAASRPMTAACRTPMVSCLHVRTAHRTDAHRPHRTGNAGCRSRAGRRGYRQEQLVDSDRNGAYRRGQRSGIGSDADGFGAARQPGACGNHVGLAVRGQSRGGPRAVSAHRARLRVRGAAAGGAAQRRPATEADHQRRAGRHHPRTARGRPGGRRRVAGGLASPAAARAEHRRVRQRTARSAGALHRTRRGSPCAATHRAHPRPIRMVGGRPVRAGLRADHAAALRRRHGGATGNSARARRRRTRRCRARSLRHRPGPAGGGAQQDQATSRRRRAAPRSAGGSAGTRVVGRRGADRHRRRHHPVGVRLPRRRSLAAAR